MKLLNWTHGLRRHRGSPGRGHCQENQVNYAHCHECTLVDVPPGCTMRVKGFLPGLAPERRAHLQAYGLSPGYWVQVIQHSPVTVVRIEHTELALEAGLARQVQVSAE